MMKKISILLSVFALIVASLACVLPTPPNSTVASGDVSATPSLIPTAAPTESATPETIPATLVPATPTLGASADNGTPGCNNHGTVAWQNDNQVSGAAYGEAPVGGLDEPCWVVAQTWWKDASGNHRAVFAVRPNSVAWLSGHKGGTGWYLSGTLAEVEANLAEQAKQLLERDGEMDTIIVILPDEQDSFPLVTRVAQK